MKWSDETHKDRSELRAIVAELSDSRCEYPVADLSRAVPCSQPMEEMAHIYPRGMGHTGARDYLNNVMAACTLHARSTDDMTSSEWASVPPYGHTPRESLAEWVKGYRRGKGWDV